MTRNATAPNPDLLARMRFGGVTTASGALVAHGFGVLAAVYAALQLGPSSFGLLALIQSAGALLGTTASFGMSRGSLRLLSQQHLSAARREAIWRMSIGIPLLALSILGASALAARQMAGGALTPRGNEGTGRMRSTWAGLGDAPAGSEWPPR